MGINKHLSTSILVITFAITIMTNAQVVYVQNDDQLKAAVTTVQPGDTIVVRNGSFDTDGSVTIKKNGTADKRIVIMAESLLGTEFINESYFDFRKCSYITLSGFIFSSTDVTAVKLQASNHIRITNNIFRIKETESTKWVYIGGIWDDAYTYSHDNRIDHNIFENKTQPGNFLTIDGSSEPTYQVSQRDTIDHNHFRNNNPRAVNEKESIRIGWSEISMSSGFTVVENNLFEDCNGDPEIISVKTCDNIIRNNTFRGSRGTLSLRHGNRTSVYGNFFFGDGVEGTGGIRLYGDDHKIYNNYFEGLTGTTWDAPITLTNGDYDGGTNYSKHFRINRAEIVFNTLVANVNGIEIGYTNNGNYSKPPRDVFIENNLVTSSENDLVKIISTPINFTWERNIFYPSGTNEVGIELPDSQISVVDPLLEIEDWLWKLRSESPAIDGANQKYDLINIDIDGQSRTALYDIGADEFSFDNITNKPLTLEDVGPKEDTLTSIGGNPETIPSEFILKQNYPNPFNSMTAIEFYIPISSLVELKIFDAIGNLVETPIREYRGAGFHRLQWDASKNSTGIYIYQIHYNGNLYSNKMIYLK